MVRKLKTRLPKLVGTLFLIPHSELPYCFSFTNYLLVFYTRGRAELVFVSDLPGCVDMKLILYQWRTNSVARTFEKLEGAVHVEVRSGFFCAKELHSMWRAVARK